MEFDLLAGGLLPTYLSRNLYISAIIYIDFGESR